jgi:Flp pilus assembly protein TadD
MDATAPTPETPVAVAAEEQMPRAPDGVMDVTANESPVAVPAQDVAMNGGPDAWQAPAPEVPAPEAQAPTPPVEPPVPEITPAQLNDASPAAPGDAPVMPVEMGSADPAPVVQTATPAEATPPAMPVQAPSVEVPPVAAAPMPTPEAMPQQGTMAQVSPPAAKSTGDAYYDAGINLPRGPIAKETIREADPSMEPGQKMIIAKKDYNQSSQEALLESASRALKLQRYDAALEMYEQLYAKNKRDRRILMGLAVAQQYTGRTESAIQTYESLLDIDPKNADAMVNMLGLLKAQYPEVALRRLMDMQKRFPGNAGIAAQIGITQAELGHHDDAVRYLQMAASLEPRNAQHLYNIAVIADRKGAKADAMKYYEQALEADAIYSGGKSLQREAIYDRLAKLRTN